MKYTLHKEHNNRSELHSENSVSTLRETSNMLNHHINNEKLNNNDDDLDENDDDKNTVSTPAISASNYVIGQNAASGTNFIEEYNNQIKSICIITGNPSFKSNAKPNYQRVNQSSRNVSQKLSINDVPDHQDLDLSQQTLNSNSNANHSVNTIDTLDIEDLHDLNNESNLNSSANKSMSQSANQRPAEIRHHRKSNSINSLNSIKMNKAATATTISISGSIGDDGSATSEVCIMILPETLSGDAYVNRHISNVNISKRKIDKYVCFFVLNR